MASWNVFCACRPRDCHSPRKEPASRDSLYSSFGPRSAHATIPITTNSGVPRLRKPPLPGPNICAGWARAATRTGRRSC
eukprot:scaffold9150_cov120-Isochrysis_galbana.AAC.5